MAQVFIDKFEQLARRAVVPLANASKQEGHVMCWPPFHHSVPRQKGLSIPKTSAGQNPDRKGGTVRSKPPPPSRRKGRTVLSKPPPPSRRKGVTVRSKPPPPSRSGFCPAHSSRALFLRSFTPYWLESTQSAEKDFAQEIERRHALLQNQPHLFFRSEATHRRHSDLACSGRRADPETIARRQSGSSGNATRGNVVGNFVVRGVDNWRTPGW